MRHLVTAAYLLLGLVGCDLDGRSTTTETSRADGAVLDSSKTQAWTDRARFECRQSSTGACHVLVFTSTCPADDCRTTIVSDFVMEPGDTRELDGLPPGFEFCLDHERRPLAPLCRKA